MRSLARGDHGIEEIVERIRRGKLGVEHLGLGVEELDQPGDRNGRPDPFSDRRDVGAPLRPEAGEIFPGLALVGKFAPPHSSSGKVRGRLPSERSSSRTWPCAPRSI